jgi:pimeloyl-ACP methyl ester carboxylesterase
MIDLLPATATSHFVEVNGVKLHYLDYGLAGRQPLLFVHGGAAHAHWFDFVAPGFSADHHVRSLDQRGHGDSAWAEPAAYSFKIYAADLNAFVEALDLRDFVLIGHSMGGIVSLLYAATYPGRVGRLVIVDSTMRHSTDRVAQMREIGTRPATRYATQEDLVARYRLRPFEGAHQAAPEVIQRMALYSGRQEADGSWRHKADRRMYARFEPVASVPLWAQIKVPTLAVKGDRTTRFTPEVLAEIRALAPQVQLAEVPGSDHHVMLDNPQGFVDAVRKFLQT